MSATPTPAASGRAPASFARVALLAAVVAVVGYGIDQFTKHLVVTRMELGERIEVIPGVLRWYSIRNSGAAFSMGEGYTWVFTIFMAIVALGVLVFLPRVRSRLWALALGGLFAGTAGNLTDRLFQPPGRGMGHVVDFISVGNFAIFNIADSLIVCSVISVVLLLWMGVPVTGGPREGGAARGSAGDPPAVQPADSTAPAGEAPASNGRDGGSAQERQPGESA
jgi:signal peptidase II